jgi:hypothetical protein
VTCVQGRITYKTPISHTSHNFAKRHSPHSPHSRLASDCDNMTLGKVIMPGRYVCTIKRAGCTPVHMQLSKTKTKTTERETKFWVYAQWDSVRYSLPEDENGAWAWADDSVRTSACMCISRGRGSEEGRRVVDALITDHQEGLLLVALCTFNPVLSVDRREHHVRVDDLTLCNRHRFFYWWSRERGWMTRKRSVVRALYTRADTGVNAEDSEVGSGLNLNLNSEVGLSLGVEVDSDPDSPAAAEFLQ